jgi:hypothetical protein
MRFAVRWGGHLMAQATLNLMSTAMRHAEFDYFVLLSGADYPIKSDHDIRAIFAAGGQYIESRAMPHSGHTLDRLDYFYIAFKNRNSRVGRILNRCLCLLPKRSWKNTVLAGMTPHSGSSWWALTRDCVDYILDFVDLHPDFWRFFHHVKYPDEVFFQTLVSNSRFSSDIRHASSFAEWSRPVPPYPATLYAADLEKLRAVPNPFARKFFLDQDPGLFDRIDYELRGIPERRPSIT